MIFLCTNGVREKESGTYNRKQTGVELTASTLRCLGSSLLADCVVPQNIHPPSTEGF